MKLVCAEHIIQDYSGNLFIRLKNYTFVILTLFDKSHVGISEKGSYSIAIPRSLFLGYERGDERALTVTS